MKLAGSSPLCAGELSSLLSSPGMSLYLLSLSDRTPLERRERNERNCLFSDVKEREGNENERRGERGYMYSLASVKSE